MPGNPLGIEWSQWGNIRATLVRRPVLYYGYFNEIRRVRPGSEAELDEALAWFRSNGIACRMRLSPHQVDEHLISRLQGRGLHNAGSLSVLFADQLAPRAQGVGTAAVRALEASQRDAFLDLWLPDGALDVHLRTLGAAEFKDWHCYVAYLDDQPAAMACMYVIEGAGVLASAWTRSLMRRSGCQSALIERRIADASAASCDLIISETEPDSASQRNLERAGLRLAFTQAIWEDQTRS